MGLVKEKKKVWAKALIHSATQSNDFYRVLTSRGKSTTLAKVAATNPPLTAALLAQQKPEKSHAMKITPPSIQQINPSNQQSNKSNRR